MHQVVDEHNEFQLSRAKAIPKQLLLILWALCNAAEISKIIPKNYDSGHISMR